MKRRYVTMSMFFMVSLGLSLTHYAPRTLSSNSGNSRKLITEQNWGNQPVRVIEVRINDNAVAFGKAFVTNESDWIHRLSVKVRNTTNKHLSHARFEVQFPLSDSPRRTLYVQSMEYGQTLLLSKPIRSIGPGETFDLSVDLNVDVLKQVVKEKAEGAYQDISAAQLSAEIVEFTDDTSWVAGEWLRFDRPTKKWIELNQAQLWKPTTAEPTFRLAGFIVSQPTNCYKSAHDIVDCPGDCKCGVRHDIATAGDPVNAGVFDEGKFQLCCTQGGIQCVVAYDGVSPGCVAN